MKIKLLLLVCLVGALNFSCSDSDDAIELVAGKLSVSEAKAGDELTISGVGFSTVKEENRVKLNELVIPVAEATASQLTLILPKEAKTGNLTVAVDDKSIDFGIFKVLEERVFALKSNYESQYDNIVEIDLETGAESILLELPWFGEESMYSSLAYLKNTNEILLISSPEEYLKKYKILRINLDTKSIIEKEFESDTELQWVELITDNESNVYVNKSWNYWDSANEKSVKKSQLFRYDLQSEKEEFLVEVKDDIISSCKVLGTDKIILVVGEEQDGAANLVVFNLLDNQTREIALESSGFFYGVMLNENNEAFVVSEGEYYEFSLLKIDLETGTSEVVLDFPQGRFYYEYVSFSIANNEVVCFRSNDDDGIDKICRINLEDKSFRMLDTNESKDWFHESLVVFM
ncbi:MAG: IPT/TIG domain-containing protein [Labilibaculum antarcticum]